MSIRHAVKITNPRASRLTVDPAVEPVSVDDLRTHLRIAGTSSDDELLMVIIEARMIIEQRLNAALITQTWQLTLDGWPSGASPWWDGVRDGHVNMIAGGAADIEIPRWPLQSITSCTVYDEDSNSTAVVVASVFDVDTQSLPGRLSLQSGATWPVALRANNAIEIVYVAGYGDAAADVPADLKRAVKQLAAALYTNRGDCSEADMMKSSGAMTIVDQYRNRRI